MSGRMIAMAYCLIIDITEYKRTENSIAVKYGYQEQELEANWTELLN